jgi:hypothetical protein
VSRSSQNHIQGTVKRAVGALLCALLCCAGTRARAATLVVNVLERDGKPLPGAVITAEPQ